MNEPKNVNETLKSIIDTLNGEWTQMQIMGRALSPDEIKRSERISNALPLLRDALGILTAEGVSEKGGA